MLRRLCCCIASRLASVLGFPRDSKKPGHPIGTELIIVVFLIFKRVRRIQFNLVGWLQWYVQIQVYAVCVLTAGDSKKTVVISNKIYFDYLDPNTFSKRRGFLKNNVSRSKSYT